MDFELCDEWFKEQILNTKIKVNETICIPNHPKKFDLLHKVITCEEQNKDEQFEEEKDKKENEKLTTEQFYDKFVRCTSEQTDIIAKYPQRSKEWIESRKYCITASDFGTVNGENPYESVNVLLKKKVFSTFKGNQYTEYGKQNEEHAKESFLEWYNFFEPSAKFREVNLIKYHQTPWMAVSPDGLIDTMDNQVDVVEFKCPARIKDSNEHPYQKYRFNTPSYYYAQIQGIAGYLHSHGTKIRHIWFVVWQPKRTWITLHSFDKCYYDSMFPKLKSFYFEKLLLLLTRKYNDEICFNEKGKMN